MIEELQISVSEFKAKALKYFEKIGKGGRPVIVTKHGKPLVRVLPFSGGSQKSYKPGMLKHTLLYEEDVISPLGAGLWEATK